MSILTSDEDNLNAELNAKQAQLASLNKDLEDLKAKRDRVTKQVDVPVTYDLFESSKPHCIINIELNLFFDRHPN